MFNLAVLFKFFNSCLINIGSVNIINSALFLFLSFSSALIVISEEMLAGSPAVIKILLLSNLINLNFYVDNRIFF